MGASHDSGILLKEMGIDIGVEANIVFGREYVLLSNN
jgi:hypothetical protein